MVPEDCGSARFHLALQTGSAAGYAIGYHDLPEGQLRQLLAAISAEVVVLGHTLDNPTDQIALYIRKYPPKFLVLIFQELVLLIYRLPPEFLFSKDHLDWRIITKAQELAIKRL